MLKINQSLLNKFFAGQCNDHEHQQVLDWLKKPENELQAKAMMEQQWVALQDQNSDAAIEGLIAKAEQQVFSDESSRRDKSKHKRKWITWTPLRAAAIWLFIILGAATLILLKKQYDAESIAAIDPTNQRTTIESLPGQVIIKVLPDGTKVRINGGSKLTYASDFGDKSKRVVYLDGEAFFDVVRNPAKPFIVKTSGISVKVLGTSFNVKSYAGDNTIETTLVHGKVSIKEISDHGKGESVELSPNQRAVFFKDKKSIDVNRSIADPTTSWAYDRLVFDETPFDEVLVQLERRYKVNIHFEATGNLKCKLTAEIQNESLTDLLDLLMTSHQFTYSISGKDVHIKGSLCGE